MPEKKLYVIGNGFDLHHEIKSSYAEFGRYVCKANPSLYDTFETYFSFEGNWSNLEDTLAHLDVDTVVEDASMFLRSYGAEDWSDGFHHDYQYEVERVVKAISTELKALFTKWISGIEIPDENSCVVPLINLDRSAKYLSFNYTNTLQKLYQVVPENVVHIHNRVSCDNPALVLGHAVLPSDIPSLNSVENLEEQDTRVTEANAIIDSYFSATYKPTAKIISQHREFFDSLVGVEMLYVLGHSLSEVDIPYFEEVVISTKPSNPKWTVTYYSESSIPNIENVMRGLGIPESHFRTIKIQSI